MAGNEAIIQEFHNNDDHRSLLLHNVQSTGNFIPSGCGTFGKIEKVKVGHSIRAAKVLDSKLYEKTIQQVAKAMLVTDFVEVCQQVTGLDHPNIAKVIGTCMQPGHTLPMLVMELLDNNLHQYLETNQNIPLVLKQSILEDVAKGLLFLHTQSPDPIVHRDLTAHNVLLTSSMIAKLTDIGNSSFADLAMRHAGSVVYGPRVRVYMPPEYEEEWKKNSPSLDVFSFGHLVLFSAIQVFPDNLLPHDYCHPENPEWIMTRSEVDRRREYFKQMDLKLPRGDKHPLVGLARDCLNNDPTQRPAMEGVVGRLGEMVEQVGRVPGEQEVMDRMEIIKLLHQQDMLHTMMPQEREEYHSRIYSLEAENEDLKMQIHSLKVKASQEEEAKETTIAEKNIQLLEIEKQVEKLQAEKTMTVLKFKDSLKGIQQKQDSQKELWSELKEKAEQLRKEEEELRQQGEEEMSRFIKDIQLTIDPVTMPSPKKSNIFDIKWDTLPDVPAPLSKHPSAVLIDRTIYVGGASQKDHAHTIFMYELDSPSNNTWSKLPVNAPRKDFGMAAIDNTLVIVGGADSSHKKSNKVTVWDPTAKQWKEGFYPTLQYARASPHITLYKNWVLVIGGVSDKPLNVIEKFDLDSNRAWSLCPPLPEKCTDISAVAVKETLYITGSTPSAAETGKVMYSILVPLLVRMKPKDPPAWTLLPNIPNSSATLCCVARKTILAFGGEIDVTSSLATLSPLLSLEKRELGTTKWERVGSLPRERSSCTCLKVGGDKVVLLGGLQRQEALRKVDVCVLQGRR